MITVFELRNAINKKSSDKAKFYAGRCSLKKQLTNGFGATIKRQYPIYIYDHKRIYNVKIAGSISEIAVILKYPHTNFTIEKVHFLGQSMQ